MSGWNRIFPFDDDLLRILDEVYIALDHNAWILAAIGIRTAFDRATELLGINPNVPFAMKLDQLLALQHVSKGQREMLEQLTEAGSAAAHRGWRPTKRDLGTLMEIIESFVHHAFVLPHDAKTLAKGVPSRPGRLAAKATPPAAVVDAKARHKKLLPPSVDLGDASTA
jgi:hypothetical protein